MIFISDRYAMIHSAEISSVAINRDALLFHKSRNIIFKKNEAETWRWNHQHSGCDEFDIA